MKKVQVHCPNSSLPFDRFIGCCNGLICMRYGSTFAPIMLLICNLATKEFRRIELPKNHGSALFCVRFGFSAILNDYKIVTQQGVYSLNTGTWREIPSRHLTHHNPEPAICANGALFWRAPTGKSLISFDIEKEVLNFSKIQATPALLFEASKQQICAPPLISQGYLGWQWQRVRTIQNEINELKKQVKPTPITLEGTPMEAPPSPVEVKIQQLTEGKELLKGSFRDRHFNAGSILLGFRVLEAVGGGVNTWFRTGKLFPDPHLFAGAGITVLWALAAALVPQM